MTYALVNDIPVSWATYHEVAASALDPRPDGLVIHVAGPTDEGVRVIDVWEDEDSFKRFSEEHLQPLLAGRAETPIPGVFRDLEAKQVISAFTSGEQEA